MLRRADGYLSYRLAKKDKHVNVKQEPLYIYTLKEAAKELCISVDDLRTIARYMGIPKLGKKYKFTRKTIKRLEFYEGCFSGEDYFKY